MKLSQCDGCPGDCVTQEDFQICRENEAELKYEALFGSHRGWDNDGSAEEYAAEQARKAKRAGNS